MADWPNPFPSGASTGAALVAKNAAGSANWFPLSELGPIDVGGDSHISEYGPTMPDMGIVERLCGYLKPALMRTCALGGAIQSFPDQGNGAQGDGGWAHIANEYNRQEQSSKAYNSTITASPASGVTSITVTSATNGATPKAGEWVVLGLGANTEEIQISQSWAGTSPVTFQTATTKSHTTGDPIYHSPRNEGYLAKSSLFVLCAEGANDLGVTGPGAPPSPLSNSWQNGTFGTTIGASVGLGPFMHALRFTLSQLRCSVIYADTHPALKFAAQWLNNPSTNTASYPANVTPFTGPNAPNYHSSTTAGVNSQVTFTTPPSFPGGTVAFFGTIGSAGQGAIWDYSVSGATTIAMTSHTANTLYDTRGQVSTNMNASAVNGGTNGWVVRITGLSPGVNVCTLQPTTIGTTAFFLGVGMEPPAPALPVIFPIATSRVPGTQNGAAFVAGPGGQYNRRTVSATGTVSLGTPSTVTFSSSLTLATAGTVSATLPQINDTITVDKGSATLEETRRITGYTGSPATACTVDSPFLNAHTTAAMQIGLQDADYVGGGFYNTADTQGAISVPGLANVISAVAGEFDSYVVPTPLDTYVNGGPGTVVNSTPFYVDGIHYNDQSSGTIASGVAQKVMAFPWSWSILGARAVTNRRTFQAVYGDAGATPAAGSVPISFVNSWTNVYSTTFASATTYPRTGYFRNPVTKEVFVRGAARGGAINTIMFTLPVGYRPGGVIQLDAWTIASGGTTYSAAAVIADATGAVKCMLNPPVTTTGAMIFGGSFIAEG